MQSQISEKYPNAVPRLFLACILALEALSSMTARADSTSSGLVETRIVDVGRDLARTFTEVLNAIPASNPGRPHRPQWLARSLGVNTVLTSRILKAAQQQDPLAVAHMIPGPEPLRRLLKAAEKRKIDPVLVREARLAVDRFEQLIDIEAGDRSSLDAIISGWLPDAREKVELLAKQAQFRGMSQLLGAACDVEHQTAILYPSAKAPGRADVLWIDISGGLRRTRPGPIVKYDTVHTTKPLLTVAGEPVDGLHGLLLEQFCTHPLPGLQVSHLADRAQYTLSGDNVGVQSAVNLVHATLLEAHKQMHRAADEPSRMATVAVGLGMPARTLIFDVLAHEAVYPGQHPTLHLYRGTLGDGAADPNDRSRDVNRLDVMESIQPLGRGIAKFRAAETPAYQDILRYACQQRGWEGSALRGYRCRIEYPIYSSQVAMSFDLPAESRIG